jgi:hypothetical protein
VRVPVTAEALDLDWNCDLLADQLTQRALPAGRAPVEGEAESADAGDASPPELLVEHAP